jgi:tol-pal system protein YbgF
MAMKPMGMKNLYIVFLVFASALWGCASQGNMEALQRDSNNITKELLALQRNLYDMNAEIQSLSGKLDASGKRTNTLQQELSEMKGKMSDASSQPNLRYQADLGARLEKLQLDVQNLTGRFEESKYFAEKTFRETNALKKTYETKIEELENRMLALAAGLEAVRRGEPIPKEALAAKTEQPAAGQRSTPPPVVTGPGKETAPAPMAEKKPVAAPQEAYQKAYDLFAKGDVGGAKRDFKRFLDVYPKSKYAENSHYWLGECYFAEKRYEEAILEFDEVIKKFPKGSKVPDALYRQGMAFLEMNDKTNAKLILKEVVRRFPKSDQANRARKKLKEL